MYKARRTELFIEYRGVNISADVSNDLARFSFTDNESGTADDIEIQLQDREGKWIREWFPALGDKIVAKIQHTDLTGKTQVLNCGTFLLDEFENNGSDSGSIVSFKAASIPQNNTIRNTKKNRAWESVRLSEIASDVAKNGNLSLNFASKVDPLFDRRTQNNTSDLGFLRQLCQEIELCIKIKNESIVIFEREQTEQNDPIATLVFGTDDVISWRFNTQNHDTASESIVEYTDPKTGKKIKHTEKDDTVTTGKQIKTVQRVENQAEAQRIAKAKLKNKNRKKVTANITVRGDIKFVAGNVVEVVGFGRFDGKYYIDSATHNIENGYQIPLELSSVLNPKEDKSEKKKAAKTKAEKSKKPKVKDKPKPVNRTLTEDEKWIMNQ